MCIKDFKNKNFLDQVIPYLGIYPKQFLNVQIFMFICILTAMLIIYLKVKIKRF